jgi:hypothetical protein
MVGAEFDTCAYGGENYIMSGLVYLDYDAISLRREAEGAPKEEIDLWRKAAIRSQFIGSPVIPKDDAFKLIRLVKEKYHSEVSL